MEVQEAAHPARARAAAGGAGTPSFTPLAARGSLAGAADADVDNGMDFGTAGQRREREEDEEDPDLRDGDDERKSSFRRGGGGGPLT